jgi:hypothetical protein
MLDRNLDPLEIEYHCECGSCDGCCKDLDNNRSGFTLEDGIRIAEFNYECKIYGELGRQIAWSE